MPSLYPAQSRIVDRLVALHKPRRAILPWDTGCGKTVAACELIKRTGARSVLIVCPAIVRQHWADHVLNWTPLTPGTITYGASAARSLHAYNNAVHNIELSDVPIVSYDLLNEISLRRYDLIILDELHHIANPSTKQARLVAALFKRYPDADIIGLSATLAPTEIQQIWNPLRLFDGEAKWGSPRRRGKALHIPYRFLARYCESEKSEYGTQYYGLKSTMAEPLRVAMSDVCYPLSRAQVLPDLPPLDLHVRLCDDRDELFRETLRTSKRTVLLTHKRMDAMRLAGSLLAGVKYCITGADSVKRRMKLLEEASRQPHVAVCATYDSMLEGIRILWPDQVLILDWSGSPGKLMQLLGRFVSVGSNARPMVTLVCSDANYIAAQAIASRAPGMIATGLATSGLESVAARIDETVNESVDWDAIFDTATSGDWSEA